MNKIYILKKRLELTSLDKLTKFDVKKYRVWIDITEPTKEELSFVKNLFDTHPLILEDMSKHLTRPKVDYFPHHSFIVLYGLVKEDKIKRVELDFLIGKNYILSNHMRKIESFELLKKDLQRIEDLLKKGPDLMLHHLVDMEIDNYMPILSSIDIDIEQLEKQAVINPTPQMLTKLFEVKRQLISIRKVASPERDVIMALTKRDHIFITLKAHIYFRDVYDHIIRINDQIENYREIISSILEVHLSVTSNKLNEIMKVLTIITTILMPITAIAGIYGMNFHNMPELSWKYGYFFAVGIMLSISAGLLIFIKKRKWI